MKKEIIGTTRSSEEIVAYTLENNSIKIRVMNYGCNLLNLWVKDKNGSLADVVLGYKNIEDYFTNDPHFGCCVFPYGNRIAKGHFELNGVAYELDKNNGNNNLHSGFDAIQRKIWNVDSVEEDSITFSYEKTDMECGFPGNMKATITYEIIDSSVKITYAGLSDKDTVFNPTNHSYFNLAGEDSGSCINQIAWIDSEKVLTVDDELIPDGTYTFVEGTPLDFRSPKAIGNGIDDKTCDAVKYADGFDHCYCISGDIKKPCASMYDPASGRFLEVFTDLPGVHFYTGNFITSSDIGKSGKPYEKRQGACFESEGYPNAVNIPSFPSQIIKAGQKATTTTIFKFSTK